LLYKFKKPFEILTRFTNNRYYNFSIARQKILYHQMTHISVPFILSLVFSRFNFSLHLQWPCNITPFRGPHGGPFPQCSSSPWLSPLPPRPSNLCPPLAPHSSSPRSTPAFQTCCRL